MFRYILKTLISHNPNHFALRNFRFIQSQSASNTNKLLPIKEKQSPTISYLVDSCGLSLESAIKASRLVKIMNKEKSDSVLELLRSRGFSQNDISTLISKWPGVISADPVKNLRPRIEFIESLGVARRDLPATFINGAQNLLATASLKKCILPNVETLRNHNVPETRIGKMVLWYPRSVAGRADTFKEVVTAVCEMGFDPKCPKFILAVASMAIMNKPMRERKKEMLLSLGWTESDFDLAFSVHPLILFNSEKKMRKMMDFLMNKVGLKASDVARCPTVLQTSLEKRVIPRWSVLQVLISKGLLQNVELIWKFNISKKAFEASMVHKFKDEIPELVRAYENQISSGEFSKATSNDAYKGVC